MNRNCAQASPADVWLVAVQVTDLRNGLNGRTEHEDAARGQSVTARVSEHGLYPVFRNCAQDVLLLIA